ncbi:MAG TPA: hypothetical protein VNZ52_04715 [Candidatus Thermoplasmatota archaeon]|nr:hypothetical protein [Candidatus Thermoplasmatota archaeon]
MEHPGEARCVTSREGCYTYLRSSHTGLVSCAAASDDGRGLLTVTSNLGSGSAIVRVTDAAGKEVFRRSFTAPYAGQFPVTGAPGEWRLDTEFVSAKGTADYALWG